MLRTAHPARPPAKPLRMTYSHDCLSICLLDPLEPLESFEPVSGMMAEVSVSHIDDFAAACADTLVLVMFGGAVSLLSGAWFPMAMLAGIYREDYRSQHIQQGRRLTANVALASILFLHRGVGMYV